MSRAIIILGMHRSGTSCLTGSLGEAGLHLGDVNEKAHCNEKGTRENVAFMEINDAVLATAGSTWDSPPTERIVWRDDHKIWRKHLVKATAHDPVWGFKDPRTLFTLDGWLESLPDANFIATFRDPFAVARSLHKRNDFTIEKGLALWRAYNERLLTVCEERDVAVVNFDWPPSQYLRGLEAICEAAKLNKPANGFAFFENRLRRNDTARHRELPPPLRTIHRRLQTAARRTLQRARKVRGARATKTFRSDTDEQGDHVADKGPPDLLTPHSVRLFPKNTGVDNYQSSGIAARCDWLVLSDNIDSKIAIRRHRDTSQPRHIFLSMRSPFVAITQFADTVLPRLTAPVVLVSGSEDVTLPRQTDKRWRQFDDTERAAIERILNHRLIKKWFVENLVDGRDERFVPMPTGWVFDDGGAPQKIAVPSLRSHKNRPLKILCGHRVRDGAQWALRKSVLSIAKNEWAQWCTIVEGELPFKEYLKMLSRHTFVLCVEGGGVDPSPKAWQAILHGAIPIIRRNALEPAYRCLPVAFIDDWAADEITEKRLEAWRRKLAPAHDVPANRAETLHRLTLDYWWDKVVDAATAQS